MKLYTVRPKWLYGDEEKLKFRPMQLGTLETLGLKECGEGYAVCNADQALALAFSGYCGDYLTPNESIKELVEIDSRDGVREMISASVAASVEAVGKLFNDKVQVEQTSANLMNVTETLLMEDACTDALQDKLTNGWRILAVCPQPQRRPDYVLGRQFAPSFAERA